MSEGVGLRVAPEVAIVLPVFDDAEWVAAALESCVAQTLRAIEIIVVDDASSDETVEVVSRAQAADPRIRLIRQGRNQSAFQARRVGISAATAPYVLFLDGDDELAPEAAATAVAKARAEGADLVGFGCQVIKSDGSTGGDYEAQMQPRHRELVGAGIVEALFPVGKTAQGQLWRYLFARELLVEAYASLPESLVLPRVNDLPIAFLALMRAHRYVSIPAKLYNYYFRRGASGHRVTAMEEYLFIAGAIDSIDAIGDAVRAEAAGRIVGATLLASYESARLSVAGRVLSYVVDIVDDTLREACLQHLTERIGHHALIRACADFFPRALPLIATGMNAPALGSRGPQHIMLRASNLGTGGAQGVVLSQADHLAQSGFTVTIAIEAGPDVHIPLRDGVQVWQLTGDSLAQRIENLTSYCRDHRVDVVIDHWIFYNDRWPYFALAAAADGIPTIGWIHNFALRPIVDGSTRLSHLERYLPLLSNVIVLSLPDVAYWKLRGMTHVAYLPNPPSPLLKNLPARSAPRTAPSGPIELVWWGRLQQSTKNVRELVEIGSILRDLEIDFRLTIIGPDGPDLSRHALHDLAEAKGIADQVVLPGPLHGDELLAAIEHAHLFVNTSLIEGYPLALVEAQALGLPLVMFDLPWLAFLAGNTGVDTVAQHDRRAAAHAIAALATDPAAYEQRSRGALTAARDALSHDFNALYTDLVRGTLAPEHSPEPTAADMRLILDHNTLYVERLIRREKRAAERARARLEREQKRSRSLAGRLEVAASQGPTLEASTDKTRRNVPSVARSGLRGWLQRLAPASMRQASYFARHHHQIASDQHQQVVANQVAISAQLAQIAASLDRGRETSDRIARAVKPLPTLTGSIAETVAASKINIDTLQFGVRHLEASAAEHLLSLGRRVDSLQGDVAELNRNVEDARSAALRIAPVEDRSARILHRVARTTDELSWSAVFHDTIDGSSWFRDRSLSPGRWAVGYPFLYVLYRVLDEVTPRSVLELGLGQSTKLIAQYAAYHDGTAHTVIEHDPAWIAAFGANYALPASTEVITLDLVAAEAYSSPVLRYGGFATTLAPHVFDLIVIDGPFGFDQDVSRVDVLDLLPSALGERFVIMLDDAHRPGEKATIAFIEEALQRSGIAYVTGVYAGAKDVWIAASADLRFLTSL